MDDLTLIQTFVQSFIQGEAILVSNPNLRIEPTFGTIQLLAKKEGLIATAKLADKPRSVLVKQKSSHWEPIHQTMLGESYFPVRQTDGLDTYQHRTIPEGYQMNYTRAIELLQRTWWRSHDVRGRRLGISMDVLILTRGTWYPARDLDLNSRNGAVYIKTLGGELTLHSWEMVIWLRKKKQDSDASTSTSGTGPSSKERFGPRR